MMLFLMVTMYFNGGLIPTYMVVKQLNLLNTRAIMILMGCVSVFNVIVTRTFLSNTIPEELYESAVMDGSDHFTYFFRILLPLSKPILAVLALYYGIALWNDYFKGLIYLYNRDLYPLQLVLRGILTQNELTEEMMDAMDQEDAYRRQRLADMMKFGLIVVSSLPILAVYPFLQKYFVKGAMIGSVKG